MKNNGFYLNAIEIRKDGFYLLFRKDEDYENVIYEKMEIFSFKYLQYICKINEGVTLRDILRTVSGMEILADFITEYSLCPKEFLQYHLHSPKTLDTKISHIEILKYIEICEDDIEICDDISAIMINEYCDHLAIGPNLFYLLDCVVEINSNCSIEKFESDISDIYVGLVEDKNIDFSFLDILHIIYFEMSFYGKPAEDW